MVFSFLDFNYREAKAIALSRASDKHRKEKEGSGGNGRGISLLHKRRAEGGETLDVAGRNALKKPLAI